MSPSIQFIRAAICPSLLLALVPATLVLSCGGVEGGEGSDLPGAYNGASSVVVGNPGVNNDSNVNRAAGAGNPSTASTSGGATEPGTDFNSSNVNEAGAQVDNQITNQQTGGQNGGTQNNADTNSQDNSNDGSNGAMANDGMNGAGGAGMGGNTNSDTNNGAGGGDMGEGQNNGQGDQNNNPPPVNQGCDGQYFCEDFEGVAAGGSPDPALWTTMTNYSPTAATENVQVSTANAHSGSQAVRVNGSAGRTGMFTELPSNAAYFMRAWFQIDSAPLGPVFIGLGQDGNSEIRLRLSNQNWGTINTVGPGDAVRPGAATSGNCAECVTLPANEWFCAEFFVDQAAQNATLWINGVQAAEIANGQGGWPEQPGNPSLFVGSVTLQGGQTDVWIDDVAAGPNRIGCE